jgi:hypothetical protein
MPQSLSEFCRMVTGSAASGTLVKLSFGSVRNKQSHLKNVYVKPVLIKNKQQLSFVYRYADKDITKNYLSEEAYEVILQLLEQDFFNADLFTTTGNSFLLQQKNGAIKIRTKAATFSAPCNTLQHDKQKTRLIAPNAPYLYPLGISTADGQVKKDGQDKYKQINHFTEVVAGVLKNIHLPESLTVTDMCSGKGYLTFALYDYLKNTLKLSPWVTGIELREQLVQKCNEMATTCNFETLHFKTGSIAATALTHTDILIALHACDTATDEAIYKGISAGASVILCAPCCHKQIRKQMEPGDILKLITRHGILMERQAEMVTDSIRALILEAYGYKTSVFDFIATEHTPKNVMIAAVKRDAISQQKQQEKLQQVTDLKKLFGIKEHYLEKLMSSTTV